MFLVKFKSNLSEIQALGNDGKIYVTRTKMYSRPTGKTYGSWADRLVMAAHVLTGGSKWIWDSKKKKWYRYASIERITEFQYNIRNLKFKDPSGKKLAALRNKYPYLGTQASKDIANMAMGGRIGFKTGLLVPEDEMTEKDHKDLNQIE